MPSRPRRSSSTASCSSADSTRTFSLGARRHLGSAALVLPSRGAARHATLLRQREPWRGRRGGKGVSRRGQNGHLVPALDATTGREVWDVPFADVRSGESATAAPLVVKGPRHRRELRAASIGMRGHIDAFDLETGVHVPRGAMIPKPGEPGSESWPDRRRGLGARRREPLDHRHLRSRPGPPVLPHRQPGPRLRRGRRLGANLFTDSGVALDPDTGAIRLALSVDAARPLGL